MHRTGTDGEGQWRGSRLTQVTWKEVTCMEVVAGYTWHITCKARFPLPESTARVDRWPVSITRQHGPDGRAFPLAELTGRQELGPLTRVVETGLQCFVFPVQVSWFAVGCYYLSSGKQELARRYLSKSTSLDRVFGPAWLAYGHSFAAENEHDQAMAAYFTASQLMKGLIYLCTVLHATWKFGVGSVRVNRYRHAVLRYFWGILSRNWLSMFTWSLQDGCSECLISDQSSECNISLEHLSVENFFVRLSCLSLTVPHLVNSAVQSNICWNVTCKCDLDVICRCSTSASSTDSQTTQSLPSGSSTKHSQLHLTILTCFMRLESLPTRALSTCTSLLSVKILSFTWQNMSLWLLFILCRSLKK